MVRGSGTGELADWPPRPGWQRRSRGRHRDAAPAVLRLRLTLPRAGVHRSAPVTSWLQLAQDSCPRQGHPTASRVTPRNPEGVRQEEPSGAAAGLSMHADYLLVVAAGLRIVACQRMATIVLVVLTD